MGSASSTLQALTTDGSTSCQTLTSPLHPPTGFLRDSSWHRDRRSWSASSCSCTEPPPPSSALTRCRTNLLPFTLTSSFPLYLAASAGVRSKMSTGILLRSTKVIALQPAVLAQEFLWVTRSNSDRGRGSVFEVEVSPPTPEASAMLSSASKSARANCMLWTP